MYGRLVGKRFTARILRRRDREHGMHACDYLLACDIDMDPVPGYAFTSWAKGYGDFRPVPDFDTLRVASWLNKTAIVICDVDVRRPRRARRARAAQHPSAPGRARREGGFTAMAASELELYVFKDSVRDGRGKRIHPDRADRPRHRGLPHPPGHEGRVPHRRDPLAPRAIRRSRRVIEGRVGTGPAGDRPPLCRCSSRWPTATPSTNTPRRRSRGRRPRHHVHGEVGRALRRLELPHSHEPLGREAGRKRSSTARRISAPSTAPRSSAGSSAAG